MEQIREDVEKLQEDMEKIQEEAAPDQNGGIFHPFDAIDIPLTLMENDDTSTTGGVRSRLRKPGKFRPVGVQALIAVTWPYDENNVVTELTFTPKAYKVNAQTGDLHNDQTRLDDDTVAITTDEYEVDDDTNTAIAYYTAGIKSNGKGTYYVSIVVQLNVGQYVSGIDEIFVRFEDAG